MTAPRFVFLILVGGLSTGCGLTGQPNVNTAELLVETQEVIGELRTEIATFQDQIDSLRNELTRQDSLLRVMANLQGMPMPPKMPTLYPESSPPE